MRVRFSYPHPLSHIILCFHHNIQNARLDNLLDSVSLLLLWEKKKCLLASSTPCLTMNHDLLALKRIRDGLLVNHPELLNFRQCTIVIDNDNKPSSKSASSLLMGVYAIEYQVLGVKSSQKLLPSATGLPRKQDVGLDESLFWISKGLVYFLVHGTPQLLWDNADV